MTNLPKVHLVMVSSLDGVIAKNSNEFIDWSSKEDKKYFSTITKEKGCLIMGSSTFKTIGKALPGRMNIVLTSNPQEMYDSYEKSENLIFMKVDTAEEVLIKAQELGFSKVVLGGGTQINTLFAKENLINYLHISIEPILVGKGMQIFSEDVEINLKFLSSQNLNENTLLINYEVL